MCAGLLRGAVEGFSRSASLRLVRWVLRGGNWVRGVAPHRSRRPSPGAIEVSSGPGEVDRPTPTQAGVAPEPPVHSPAMTQHAQHQGRPSTAEKSAPCTCKALPLSSAAWSHHTTLTMLIVLTVLPATAGGCNAGAASTAATGAAIQPATAHYSIALPRIPGTYRARRAPQAGDGRRGIQSGRRAM